jgi:hypothetical protein
VALSGVKSPGDLCILLPDDMDDFTIRALVNLDIAQILETMQSSRPLLISQISPGNNVKSAIASTIHLMQFYQTNFLAPTTTSTLPGIKFVVFPVSIMMFLKHLVHTRRRYFSMFGSCHGSLRTNRCFDLTASEISSLKSLSSDLLCLLRPYSSGTLNLLHKIHIGTGQIITIPDETTICEFFIRNPNIVLLIPRDLRRLSSTPYSSIITISSNP